MEPENFVIDVTLVSDLIRNQFPQWAGLPVTPVLRDGWDNRSFRLGQRLLVRLPSAERYAAQVDVEQQWLPLLAPHLPVSIPVPVAMGRPSRTYPWRWSVYRWLPGETAMVAEIADMDDLASALAKFLADLHLIPTGGGPRAGPRSFHRGGRLSAYDGQARQAFAMSARSDSREMLALWDAALDTQWDRRSVWVHGDFAPRNILINRGILTGVIDFGQLSVGDPACDLAIAWTFFRARAAGVSELSLDWTATHG